MNNVALTGRLTREPEIRYTAGAQGIAVLGFTLAVNRKYSKDGEPTADFPNCKAFGKNAEGIGKYCKKGTKIEVRAHVQTGSYTTKEGNKVYTTDFIIDEWEFAESKAAGQNQSQSAQQDFASAGNDEFMLIDEEIAGDEDTPF